MIDAAFSVARAKLLQSLDCRPAKLAKPLSALFGG
jgi:hypothetical protein